VDGALHQALGDAGASRAAGLAVRDLAALRCVDARAPATFDHARHLGASARGLHCLARHLDGIAAQVKYAALGHARRAHALYASRRTGALNTDCATRQNVGALGLGRASAAIVDQHAIFIDLALCTGRGAAPRGAASARARAARADATSRATHAGAGHRSPALASSAARASTCPATVSCAWTPCHSSSTACAAATFTRCPALSAREAFATAGEHQRQEQTASPMTATHTRIVAQVVPGTNQYPAGGCGVAAIAIGRVSTGARRLRGSGRGEMGRTASNTLVDKRTVRIYESGP
jgi:hypothetical protein